MKRPFAVFDIDGTLIRWQLYHSIVQELAHRGLLGGNAIQTINEARMIWKQRSHSESFKAYEEVLVNIYNDAVQDIAVKDYLSAVDRVFEIYKDQVYVYTRDLIRKLKAENYLLFAISGSQQEIVQKLADYYGFDVALGTEYEQQSGRFTGKIVGGVLGNKAELLVKLIKQHHVMTEKSVAVGDSEGDISMLEMVEQPVAFNPSARLFATAKERGWKIVVERKNMIYELEASDGSYILA